MAQYLHRGKHGRHSTPDAAATQCHKLKLSVGCALQQQQQFLFFLGLGTPRFLRVLRTSYTTTLARTKVQLQLLTTPRQIALTTPTAMGRTVVAPHSTTAITITTQQ